MALRRGLLSTLPYAPTVRRPEDENELCAAYGDPGRPLRDLLALVWRSGGSDGWVSEQMNAPVVYRCMEISVQAQAEGGSMRDVAERAQGGLSPVGLCLDQRPRH